MDQIAEEFKIIGWNKYRYLKSFDYNKMSAEEMVQFREANNISVAEAQKQIQKFEKKNNSNSSCSEKTKSYFESLRNPQVKKEKILSKEEFKDLLYKKFIRKYFELNGEKYSTDEQYLENLKPVFYYFLGDYKSFISCSNLLKKENCVPSLSKGLLIIGNFGNGKTSTLVAFSEVAKGTKKYFDVIGSKQAATNYSFLKNDPIEQEAFYKKLITRQYFFDDLLKESDASSYGKLNLMEQVLEERYRKRVITHATLNYKNENGKIIKDLDTAVSQLGERYGGYMYDRVFSMFNIIEFKGKSLRK
ncbi:conserved hypothetical protein [Tenacibaculum sp. 190524A05c]|uniref:hypothetical protein n=1 Tax=Tenacibaculum platacis TaxID=3137852 RepID=UPI0031FAC688